MHARGSRVRVSDALKVTSLGKEAMNIIVVNLVHSIGNLVLQRCEGGIAMMARALAASRRCAVLLADLRVQQLGASHVKAKLFTELPQLECGMALAGADQTTRR